MGSSDLVRCTQQQFRLRNPMMKYLTGHSLKTLRTSESPLGLRKEFKVRKDWWRPCGTLTAVPGAEPSAEMMGLE